MDRIVYMRTALIFSLIAIASCSSIPQTAVSQTSSTKHKPVAKHVTPTKPVEIMSLQGDNLNIWKKLQQTPMSKLRTQLEHNSSQSDIAWFKLAIISKQYGHNTTDLINELIRWRADYPQHPANSLFSENEKLTSLISAKPRKHIALLLPLHGPLAPYGEAVRDGYLSAYYDSLTNKTQEQTISFFDTEGKSNLSEVYQEAVKQGADVIVGPLSREQVKELASKENYPIPTIALNYLDNDALAPHLIQFGLSQKDEAEQLADKAIQTGKSRAIIISSNELWSETIVKTLTERWEAQGGKVIDKYTYPARANFTQDIARLMGVNPIEDRAQMDDDNTKNVLQQQRRQDFDTLFLIALPQQARTIVPLLKYYYADDIPIYSTSVVYTGSPAPQKDKDLNGVIFCDIPWVFANPSQTQHNRLYAVGRDAQLLSNELERLTALPHFPLPASTGLLSLNSKQQIYRQVPWTQMHAGHP